VGWYPTRDGNRLQSGNFAARLDEAEHVVHHEQHVLPLAVAEVLGNGQRRVSNPPARARRFIHLPIDENRSVEHS
jgi:hypothetical protein